MNRCVLGVDIGTSSCKTIVVDEKGCVVAETYREYEISMPCAGYCEQEPTAWRNAAFETIAELCANRNLASRIVGIGLSGQMHGLVLLDKQGNVLRPCIIWADQRSSKQCETIERLAGGAQKLLRMTNNKMLTTYTGSKLLWVRENEPEIFAQAETVLNPKDYIRYCLTGEIATDVSDASGTGLFDVRNRRWSEELIHCLGLPMQLFPTCFESTEISGVLSRIAAEKVGLRAGIPVVGGGDAIVQSIGAGVVNAQTSGITIGTGGQLCRAYDSFVENEQGMLQIFCNAIPDKWHAMGVMQTAGGVLKWLKDVLYFAEAKQMTSKRVFELLDREAEQVPAGADGLVFLPYLNGERCPHNDPQARGAFVGMTLRHQRGHLARSVLEGIAFGMREMEEVFPGGTAGDRFVFSGGGATSRIWRQIFADVFQKQVFTVGSGVYGAAYGAAMLAGVSAGVWDSIACATETLHPQEQHWARISTCAVYDSRYSVYRKLYTKLRDDFAALSQ